MSRRAIRSPIDRATSGAMDFDAALEAYLNGGDPEGLLRAAAMVIECNLPMHRELADIVCGLTGNFDILIETYSDAAYAIRRWFALMEEDGARH
jgi:hypothetical protein